MVTVERDGAYLIYRRDGAEFYDTGIQSEAGVGQFIRHMDDKAWFHQVRSETLRLIREYHGEPE